LGDYYIEWTLGCNGVATQFGIFNVSTAAFVPGSIFDVNALAAPASSVGQVMLSVTSVPTSIQLRNNGVNSSIGSPSVGSTIASLNIIGMN